MHSHSAMKTLRNIAKQCLRATATSRPFKSFLKLVDYQLAPYKEIEDPSKDSLAAHIATVLTRLQINCVLDVGANRGQTGRLLRRLGYYGRIVSFEPVSRNFEVLAQQCMADPDWRCHQLALGARDGEQIINLARHSVFDSFLSPTEYSIKQFGGDSEVTNSETVTVQRLETVIDSCVDGLATPRIFLKIDTQGYDLQVLEGAGRALACTVCLQVELSVKPVYEGMINYLDAIPRINALGFEITGLFPVNRDALLRVVEFDCVAVRPNPP
jgi:FkbM family methyltransferase